MRRLYINTGEDKYLLSGVSPLPWDIIEELEDKDQVLEPATWMWFSLLLVWTFLHGICNACSTDRVQGSHNSAPRSCLAQSSCQTTKDSVLFKFHFETTFSVIPPDRSCVSCLSCVGTFYKFLQPIELLSSLSCTALSYLLHLQHAIVRYNSNSIL